MKPRTRLSRLAGIVEEALARAEATPTRAKAILGDQELAEAHFRIPEGHPAPAGGLLEDRTPGGNKTERAYGDHLDRLVVLGEVARWWWQPGSFRLATVQTEKGTTSDFYRPDFLVQLPSGLLEIHETKGLMRDDARTKLKVFASIYPYPVVIIRRVKGTFQATRYARGSV